MIGLLALALASAFSCSVEEARYVLRNNPHVEAHFERVSSGSDWPSGLALATKFRDTKRTYWWLPYTGGTNDLQNVASTTDVHSPSWHPPSPDGGPRPLGDMEYIATDAGYNVIDSIPHQGSAAPAHILLSRLGDAVWHNSTDKRDRAPKQFFDLVDCSKRHPAR